MKLCKKCGGEIPPTIIIDGKRRNLASRRYCLACAPFGKHSRGHTLADGGAAGVCLKCGRDFVYSRAKGHRRTSCNTCMVNKRRPERKAWAIEHKGGKCLVCGYSACVAALDFHHVDPQEKDTVIAVLYMAKMERFLAELNKCVLLCCRCHAEHHAGMISTEELVALEFAR